MWGVTYEECGPCVLHDRSADLLRCIFFLSFGELRSQITGDVEVWDQVCLMTVVGRRADNTGRCRRSLELPQFHQRRRHKKAIVVWHPLITILRTG